MALVSQYTRGKLLRVFSALGPYVREPQCQDGHYFFDCLAVCVNAAAAPEKREFYGWWLTLTPQSQGFVFEYHLGMYDKHGAWQEKTLSEQTISDEVSGTLTRFHPRLTDALRTLGLALTPSPVTPPPVELPE